MLNKFELYHESCKKIQIESGLIILFSNISRSKLTTVSQGTVQELAAFVRNSLPVVSRWVRIAAAIMQQPIHPYTYVKAAFHTQF